jgi:hypothetical protein
MFSPVLWALAVLYTICGVVITRRIRKPTCRVCLFRQLCTNRESEYYTAASKPRWSCDQTAICASPTHEAES